MAKKIEKTNAARLLDKAGISYKLIPYEFDENDLAAQHVADSLGQDIARVFKTLVLHGDKTGHIVCVVPGNAEVDLKALAKASGNKKVEMIAMKDLLSVTGYIRGGCSPVGMKKRFPTFFHSTALSFETIYVSAGVRGLQLEIDPADLISFTGGSVADVATALWLILLIAGSSELSGRNTHDVAEYAVEIVDCGESAFLRYVGNRLFSLQNHG